MLCVSRNGKKLLFTHTHTHTHNHTKTQVLRLNRLIEEIRGNFEKTETALKDAVAKHSAYESRIAMLEAAQLSLNKDNEENKQVCI